MKPGSGIRRLRLRRGADEQRSLGESRLATLTPQQRAEIEARIASEGPAAFVESLDPVDRAFFESEVAKAMHEEQQRWVPRRTPIERLKIRLRVGGRRLFDVVTLPAAIVLLLSGDRFDPSYGLTWRRRFALGFRMYANTRRIQTGTDVRAHLAMAAKLFEIPPSVEGVVVECGTWKGGTTTNLSLLCEVVGRDLIAYDSFEGLPAAPANDKYAWPEGTGLFDGSLEEVTRHVATWGAIDRCTFRKGLFSETLPHHDDPVVLCFLDVDYASSLHDCVINLWPHLTRQGYVFIDEYVRIDYCALFFSERWWRRYLGTTPPGMMGVGTGVGVGQHYLGPFTERPLAQTPISVAYTRRDFSGLWDYDPENPDEVAKARFGPVPPRAAVLDVS
jgi:hypothetical protein